jgi:HEAT repeat protein
MEADDEWFRALRARDEEQIRRAREDPRSTQDLISIALTGSDEHAAWEPIGVLQWRGTRDVLVAAQRLCASPCQKEQALGARILGQLGLPERTFPDESLEALLELLRGSEDAEVLYSAAIACGHLKDARAIEALLKFKSHASDKVRYGVVYGLLSQEDDRAIRALIELSADSDTDVRDWATFGLGQLIDSDTPEIREALCVRLTDEDVHTRAEALMGLARRRDERVIQPLLEELTPERVFTLVVEAAGETEDPRLHPALVALRGQCNVDDAFLEEAITRCRPRNAETNVV